MFFPGSTIGNLEPKDAIHMLNTMGRIAGRYGAVIVGADLKKDPKVLEAAYNDKKGLTAEFNLNILAHLNRRFDADFDLDAFAARGADFLGVAATAASRTNTDTPRKLRNRSSGIVMV